MFIHEAGYLCSHNMGLSPREFLESCWASVCVGMLKKLDMTLVSAMGHGLASESEPAWKKQSHLLYLFLFGLPIRRYDTDLGWSFLLQII